MSSPLQNNTTELQNILDIVNNLPLAGGSGSGGDVYVETCQIDITVDFPTGTNYAYYTTYVNDQISATHMNLETSSPSTIEVVKNTMFVILGDFESCSELDKTSSINAMYGNYFDPYQIFYATGNGYLTFY